MSARMGRAGQRGAVTQCYGNIYNFYEYSQLPRVMSLGRAVLASDIETDVREDLTIIEKAHYQDTMLNRCLKTSRHEIGMLTQRS